jgi:hypothetical protein
LLNKRSLFAHFFDCHFMRRIHSFEQTLTHATLGPKDPGIARTSRSARVDRPIACALAAALQAIEIRRTWRNTAVITTVAESALA